MSLSPSLPSSSHSHPEGTQRESPCENSHMQVRKRALTRSQPLLDLDLGLPASTTKRNTFLLFKPPCLQSLLWQLEVTQTAHLPPFRFLRCEPGTSLLPLKLLGPCIKSLGGPHVASFPRPKGSGRHHPHLRDT